MALTLSIQNADRLENGSPLSVVVDRRGAVIGRSAAADWSLPDRALIISSRHCEIRFNEGRYELVDRSTNGTFLLGQRVRLPGPHAIAPGDVFVIGHYQIRAALDDAGQYHPDSSWGSAPRRLSGLGAPRERATSWNPAPLSVPAAPTPSPAPSAWSSAALPPVASGSQEMWGRFDASNAVDWARGGFSGPDHPANQQPAIPLPASHGSASGAAPLAAPPPAPTVAAGAQAFTAAVGIPPERLRAGEEATMAQAGRMLRQLVAGLVVMLEARTRAKSQLGAHGTSLEFHGNNPLKFARTPDQALEQLLNPPEQGFMDGGPAIEDAFRDLQAHQMATLRAMQGALRATLDRFSPNAIRARAETSGVIARVVPAARDAALWAAYEREFSGVAQGSDEAFMEMFAREFRRAYEEAVHQR